MTSPRELVFIKLGGSLITNKRQRHKPETAILQRLARELRAVREARPDVAIVLGHGSGSFGHWEAKKYDTRAGVHGPEAWQGFTQVSAAALQLNRLVVDIFVKVGVPVLSLQPLASAMVDDGTLTDLNLAALQQALDHNLVPLVFGDVAFDKTRGGTIVSTEDIFVYLAHALRPSRILLLGNAPGVLDSTHTIIPQITPASYGQAQIHLRGSSYTDVTGGMADKVERMVQLVAEMPDLRVWILTGRKTGNLQHAILHPDQVPGTLICASPSAATPES